MHKHNRKTRETQEQGGQSRGLEKACYRFLRPLLAVLDSSLDCRLVETFLCLVLVMLMHRHRNHGLL